MDGGVVVVVSEVREDAGTGEVAMSATEPSESAAIARAGTRVNERLFMPTTFL
jgi:hypothetical protein